MQEASLIRYAVATAVVWALILGGTWLVGGVAQFKKFALVGGGFAIGMLAMYIAVHVYK